MNRFKKITCFALAGISSFLFSACSENSSSGNKGAGPQDIHISLSECGGNVDTETMNLLQEAIDGSISTLNAFASGDYAEMQNISASNQAQYQSVLNENPTSCAAQFGYALTLIANLVNHSSIEEYYKALSGENDSFNSSSTSLFKVSSDDYPQVLMKSANASTDQLLKNIQPTLATEVVPTLDSATAYMQNVVNQKSFSITFNISEGKKLRLDNSAFAPALGILQFVKAVVTIGASLNLDASKEGSYNWALESSIDHRNHSVTKEEKKVFNHVISLLNKSSSFSTIYSSWQKRYQAIPDLLDSALANVQDGLQFSLTRYEQGNNSLHDLYIVGVGEEADMSPSNTQKAIDALDSIRTVLQGPVNIYLNNDVVVKVNVRKFFSIVDGFQDYLPYHKFTDPKIWKTYVDSIGVTTYWSSIPNEWYLRWFNRHSYMEEEVSQMVFSRLNVLEVGIVDDRNNKDSLRIRFDYLDSNNNHSYSFTKIIFSGCDYSILDHEVLSDQTYTLSANSCRDNDGVAEYKVFSEYIYDRLRFTDAKGNETIPLFVLEIIELSASEMSQYIILPDPTFNGIFPEMTQEKFWQTIENL